MSSKEYMREYMRGYMRRRVSENREGYNQEQRKWRDEHPQEWYEIRMRYHYKNMDAYRCQAYAKRKYPEKQPCGIKDCCELGERHHDDYSKPYEIRWLCRKHHRRYHRDLIVF